MALQIQSPFPSFTRNLRLLHSPTRPKLIVRSQNPSVDGGAAEEPAAKKPVEPGKGFGKPSSTESKPKADSVGSKKNRRIIRRSPVQKPVFAARVDEAKAKEQGRNESAFLLTWAGLGGVILFQGLVLATSGFLPEEWDNLFVKYLYPSFTPIVFLFVAGTVVYGVLKYLQNEKLNDQSGTK